MTGTHLQPASFRSLREQGFTLIEMLVVMTVLAIMLAVGVPSFRNFVAGQKVKTASYDLMTALVLARSEAIKRNTDVTVAPDTANVWIGGWTVKAGATTLVQQQSLSGVTVTKAPTSVVYKSNGRPTAGSNFEVSGSNSVKCVKVDLTGIPSSQTAACP